jgi:hypothetical protein
MYKNINGPDLEAGINQWESISIPLMKIIAIRIATHSLAQI